MLPKVVCDLPEQTWIHILKKLHPREILKFSLACKKFYNIVDLMMLETKCDASGGLEKFPVPYVSTKDGPKYSFFQYQKHTFWSRNASNSFTESAQLLKDGNDTSSSNPTDDILPLSPIEEGCFHCSNVNNPIENKFFLETRESICEPDNCPCGVTATGFPAFKKDGTLLSHTEMYENDEGISEIDSAEGDPICIFECGPSCTCSQDCPNRISQNGLTQPVRISWHCGKGWCLESLSDIKRGSFLCEYTGNLTLNIYSLPQENIIYFLPQKRGNSVHI